jgi:hypothetical protein
MVQNVGIKFVCFEIIRNAHASAPIVKCQKGKENFDFKKPLNLVNLDQSYNASAVKIYNAASSLMRF